MKPNSLFRRLAGNLPGVGLWLAVLPLAALGQANYATPYTFITLAGRAGISGTADGTGSTARFNGPTGVVLDSAGNLYVADSGNNTIRKVTPQGLVTTLAGKAGASGSADGTNSAARFNLTGNGGSLALDSTGNLYLADCNNHTIRKVSPVGTNWVVTTLAGRAGVAGSAEGTNSVARFYWPCGLATDPVGNLYVADLANNTIRKVTPDGTNWVVTTLAGMPGYTGGETGNTGSADGTNSAARFNWPWGLALDSAGNVYVADQVNYTIRKLTPDGTNWVVTTLAGLAKSVGYADGTASTARFHDPVGLAVDTNGDIYLAEYMNYTIRKGMLASSVPPPILQPPSLNAGLFGFGITGLPGLAVNIESSTNLSSWQLITTFVLMGGTNYYSASPNPAQGAQFYRAHVR